MRLLAGRVQETCIALTGAPEANTPRIVHRRAARARAALEADLGVVAEPLPVTSVSGQASALAHLERTFLGGESTREPADGAISLVATTDRAAEVRAALRWLKARVVEDGLRLNQTALLARRLKPYQSLVAATAAEFGIPVHIAGGLPLAINPAVSALLDLLRLTLPDQTAFPWRLTVETWRSPHLDWGRQGIVREDAEALTGVARWGNVLGGLEAWRENFALLVETAEGPQDDENGPDDEGSPPGSAPHGAAAQALWDKFEAFVTRVTPPEGTHPCRVFVAWLHPLIGAGVHVRPADGRSAEFLRAYDVPEPAPLAEPVVSPKGKPLDWWADPEARPQGRSTMHKWTCGCQIVRVGTKEFHAQCLRCGNLFERAEAPARRDAGAPQPQAHPDAMPTNDSEWRQGEIAWEETALSCNIARIAGPV